MKLFKIIITIVTLVLLSSCVNNVVTRGPIVYSFTKTDNKNEFLTYQSVSIYTNNILTDNIVNLMLCKIENHKMLCQKLDTSASEKEINELIRRRNEMNRKKLKSNDKELYIK